MCRGARSTYHRVNYIDFIPCTVQLSRQVDRNGESSIGESEFRSGKASFWRGNRLTECVTPFRTLNCPIRVHVRPRDSSRNRDTLVLLKGNLRLLGEKSGSHDGKM